MTQIEVETVRGDGRRAALEVLLQDLAPSVCEQQIAETLDAAARGDVSLDGLLIARAAESMTGVVLCVLQPDGCAFVWPPVVSPEIDADSSETVADELLQAVGRLLDERQAWLGQSLLDPDNERDARRLQRNGFEFLADLAYLQRPLDGEVQILDSPLIVESADPEVDAARLAAIVERTYAGSADCPRLNGLRTGMEAVAGHRLTGLPLADGWLVFRDSSGDAGVLLLADQPEQNACELVYMGVVPEARGRGYGRAIVETAVRRAAESGRRDLLLAVDERNRYAAAIYESAGFQVLDRKRVFGRRGRTDEG